MRIFQPERALIAREIHEERRRELNAMLSQLPQRRADRLPAPPPLSLEAQFQRTIVNMRDNVQRAKDVQSTHILRWLRS
ncbi:MAG: hypothetical protein ABSC21_19440 [Terriglobia bacterium]